MTVAPDVVPNIVRDVNAFFYGGEHTIGRPLCTDSRMGQVWETLMMEARNRELANPKEFKDRLDSLRDIYRIETWHAPTGGVSLADQACASFFLATSIIFGVGNHAVTESRIQKELKRLRDGAALCREALHSPHRAASDPELAAALAASAAYFEEWAKVLSNANMNSPYLVERATGDRDDTRVQVRHVATVTREIFGSFMYGTVATTASVAKGSSITWKNVENWCNDDLTLPSH
jgi:hypothetical protein